LKTADEERSRDRGLFPGPGEVLVALWAGTRSGVLLTDALWGLSGVLGGFVAGSLPGVVLGLLTARSQRLRQIFEPLIQVARPVPVIAMVPLTIVWFGIGEGAKWLLIAWGSFFPVWVNAHLGASSIPEDYLVAARTLPKGASRVRRLGQARWSEGRGALAPICVRP
jgi:NitT/TauT family transport system permease protein